jgi:hypothetical protein
MDSKIRGFWHYTVAVLVAAGCFVPQLFAAGPAGVPEVDGSMVTAGVGLLAAGVLIIRARRQAK